MAELVSFDRSKKFQAGEFRFAPPSPANVLGTERRGGTKTGTGKPRTKPHVIQNIRSRAPK